MRQMPGPCPEGHEIKGGQNPSNASDQRPPKPGGSGSVKLYSHADADALLKAVYDVGCELPTGEPEDTYCWFCGAMLDTRRDGMPYESHADDCTYFRIEAYLKVRGRL